MGGSEISNGMSEGEGSPDPPSSAGEVVQGDASYLLTFVDFSLACCVSSLFLCKLL